MFLEDDEQNIEYRMPNTRDSGVKWRASSASLMSMYSARSSVLHSAC
jgi:hypothetical protein